MAKCEIQCDYPDREQCQNHDWHVPECKCNEQGEDCIRGCDPEPVIEPCTCKCHEDDD